MTYYIRPKDPERFLSERRKKRGPMFSPEQKKARAAQRLAEKRERWEADLAATRERHGAKRELPTTADMRKVDEEKKRIDAINKVLRSQEFAAWYEATTGAGVDEFLADVAISPAEYITRYPGESIFDQTGWVQARVEEISRKNYWRDPEVRESWGLQLSNVTDARERRRVLLNLAKPRWADQDEIDAIYAERSRIVAKTGVPHDVDHVVPIVSKVVCGLHCAANLQIIPAGANRSKSNKFCPVDFSVDLSPVGVYAP